MKIELPFKITRPLIFFDTETTGTNVAVDRICELSAIKFFPDGKFVAKSTVIDPTVPIPRQASDVHGITDAVITKMREEGKAFTFEQMALPLFNFFSGSDLCGYNGIWFDIPLLAQEFYRAGIEGFPAADIKFIDPCNIFKKREKRDLSAGLMFYCGKQMQEAHQAMADTEATVEILLGQIKHYPDLNNATLDDLVEDSKHGRNVDLGGSIVLNDNDVPVFSFGKHKDKPVRDTLIKDKRYYEWLLSADFTFDTKNHFKRILLGK